jgi:hypothetical protein
VRAETRIVRLLSVLTEMNGSKFSSFKTVILKPVSDPATSSPADDVHHYVIPPKLPLPIDSIFNKLPVFMRQWGKERAVLYTV